MAGKALNAKNLEELGAERLSELVMDLCQGSAALKRQARAALLEASGSAALSDEMRKRLATIKRSKTRVGWRKRKALHTDLDQQRLIITEKIAPRDPAAALDLMWEFCGLANSIFPRIDDSQGTFAALFQAACDDLGRIALDAKSDALSVADHVASALTDHNRYGEFDGLLPAIKDALGANGLSALKGTLAQKAASGNDSSYAARRRSAGVRFALMQIADLEGDPDAFVALVEPSARRIPKVACEIALRLIAAERAEEAIAALDDVDQSQSYLPPEWFDARIKALDALGRGEDAQALRWQQFERTFAETYLRDYLSALPDFDDLEAEDKALDFVAADKNIHRALAFLIAWPALDRAAALVMAHRETLDGSFSNILTPAADALESRYPLAAVALRRVIIEDTLTHARSKRYKTAARHFLECESADAALDSYDPLPSHDVFAARLKDRHGRKAKFWDEVWS